MNAASKTGNSKYAARISRMSCGQSVDVPSYGKVTAYRCPKSGRRMFKLTDSSRFGWIPQGNLSLNRIVQEVKSVCA